MIYAQLALALYLLGFLWDARRSIIELWSDVEQDTLSQQIVLVALCCLFSLAWPVVIVSAIAETYRNRAGTAE